MFVSDDDGDGNEKSSAFRLDMKNDYLIRITSAIAHVLLAFDGGLFQMYLFKVYFKIFHWLSSCIFTGLRRCSFFLLF